MFKKNAIQKTTKEIKNVDYHVAHTIVYYAV